MTETGHPPFRPNTKLVAWLLITFILILLTLWISRWRIKAIEDQQKRWGDHICQTDNSQSPKISHH